MLNSHIEIRDSWPLLAGNPLHYLNCLRDTKNETAAHHHDKIEWLGGKIQLGIFVAQNGGRSPQSLATIIDGRVVPDGFRGGETASCFLEHLPPGQYFCKPDRSGNGIGGFTLDLSGYEALVDGETQSLTSIGVLLSSRPYLVQLSLTPLQHPDIARFNRRTLNTLRLVTFDTESGPAMVAASLRIATTNAAVDNWSAGGVAVPIDLKRGVLCEFGIVKKGLNVVDAHPQSGQSFRGQAVPHFDAAAAMACSLHRKLKLSSVGWDIALLRDGPCIVEANRPWGIFMSAQFNPGFVRTFLDFHLSRGMDAVSLELTGAFRSKDAVRLWLSAAMGVSRASARVDYLSSEQLALTVGGSEAAIETAMQLLRQPAFDLSCNEMRFAPSTKEPPRGLDIGATFLPDVAPSMEYS